MSRLIYTDDDVTFRRHEAARDERRRIADAEGNLVDDDSFAEEGLRCWACREILTAPERCAHCGEGQV